MPFPLSHQSIDAIADIISGGPSGADTPPTGIYRSGPEIERFMRACNVTFSVAGSRVPSLTNCLLDINNELDPGKPLTRVIEAAADPRDFHRNPERHGAVVNFLNRVLAFDGFQLQARGLKIRLVEKGQGVPVLEKLSELAGVISFDTVARDLDRALESAEGDPEDAITAACSTVESVCRSILVELDKPLPAKKDVKSLYHAVRGPLGLSPDRSDIDPVILDDVVKILGGLSTAIEGIGALRTHAGDAHGREKGYARVDRRIASLAIHSASTLALFLIETWRQKFPARPLHNHLSAKDG